jgi:hypothetical protein
MVLIDVVAAAARGILAVADSAVFGPVVGLVAHASGPFHPLHSSVPTRFPQTTQVGRSVKLRMFTVPSANVVESAALLDYRADGGA